MGSGEVGPQSEQRLHKVVIPGSFKESNFCSVPQGSSGEKRDHSSQRALSEAREWECFCSFCPQPPGNLNTQVILAFHAHRPTPLQQPEDLSPTKIGRCWLVGVKVMDSHVCMKMGTWEEHRHPLLPQKAGPYRGAPSARVRVRIYSNHTPKQ